MAEIERGKARLRPRTPRRVALVRLALLIAPAVASSYSPTSRHARWWEFHDFRSTCASAPAFAHASCATVGGACLANASSCDDLGGVFHVEGCGTGTCGCCVTSSPMRPAESELVLSELARPAAGLDMAHMSVISAEPAFK